METAQILRIGRTIALGANETIFSKTIDLINESGYRIDFLAEMSGVSESTLYNWLNGGVKSPRMATVQNVLRALGYELRIVRVGFKH